MARAQELQEWDGEIEKVMVATHFVNGRFACSATDVLSTRLGGLGILQHFVNGWCAY
jgi:hypothetical protein